MTLCYYLRNTKTGLYFAMFGDVEETDMALTLYKKEDKLALELLAKYPDYEWVEEVLK